MEEEDAVVGVDSGFQGVGGGLFGGCCVVVRVECNVEGETIGGYVVIWCFPVPVFAQDGLEELGIQTRWDPINFVVRTHN